MPLTDLIPLLQKAMLDVKKKGELLQKAMDEGTPLPLNKPKANKTHVDPLDYPPRNEEERIYSQPPEDRFRIYSQSDFPITRLDEQEAQEGKLVVFKLLHALIE
jgi:hypothetical protein